MSLFERLRLPDWVFLIEFVGALMVVGYCIAALVVLVRSRRILLARLVVADGVILGLNFKLAATVLRTVFVHSWPQILMFATVLALRTLVKRLFTWERERLDQQRRS